jgi:hypothetical protein
LQVASQFIWVFCRSGNGNELTLYKLPCNLDCGVLTCAPREKLTVQMFNFGGWTLEGGIFVTQSGTPRALALNFSGELRRTLWACASLFVVRVCLLISAVTLPAQIRACQDWRFATCSGANDAPAAAFQSPGGCAACCCNAAPEDCLSCPAQAVHRCGVAGISCAATKEVMSIFCLGARLPEILE